MAGEEHWTKRDKESGQFMGRSARGEVMLEPVSASAF
jgi:hypothetical protein